MQKTLFVASLLVLAAFSFSVNYDEMTSLWGSWKAQHGKTYATMGEEKARFAIFMDNFHHILKFNAESKSVKLAMNHFGDLTGEEFKEQNSRCAHIEDDEELVRSNTVKFDTTNLPTSVDWRTKGVVTPVKNQQQCGSCWAFSTTGVIEGYYAIKNGKLLSFSEQQIVDCDTTCYGCGGGWPYLAVEYAAQNGLETESDYPYTAMDGTCKYSKSKAVQTNNGYAFVTPDSANDLMAAIVNSPVSVAIEADQSVFQFYSSGVISSGCGDGIDHAVLAVGYTTVSGEQAYIVKNSWGTSWGDQGYVYISTDGSPNQGEGVCGILYQPVIAN